MIRLLHISDVHLGAGLSGFGSAADGRRASIRDAFRQLPERATEWEVDAVLVAGDLFDGPRAERSDVDMVREVLRGLAAGRPVFVIPGNHDAIAGPDSPWLSMPESVTVVRAARFAEPLSVDVGDERLHVYGVAFDRTVEADPLAGYHRAEEAGHHVILLHAGAADHPDWTGGQGLRTTSAELSGLDADYIALGDHHAFRPPSDFSGAPACYPGSFAAVAVDEIGPHGCVIVELATGVPPLVRLEASPVAYLVDVGTVDVSDAESEIDVAERIGSVLGSEDAYPVATLSGEPPFPLDAEPVRDALRERFGFAVVRDETRFIDSAHVRALAARPTIAGHVARLGLKRVGEAEGEIELQRARRALRLALGALEREAT